MGQARGGTDVAVMALWMVLLHHSPGERRQPQPAPRGCTGDRLLPLGPFGHESFGDDTSQLVPNRHWVTLVVLEPD